MKKALLWLGPLVCLAVIVVVSYLWFGHDPLAARFDEVEEGMTLQEAINIVGRSPDSSYDIVHVTWDDKVIKGQASEWKGKHETLYVVSQDGRIAVKNVQESVSLACKPIEWVCSFWAPAPVAYAPPTVPAAPVSVPVANEDEP